MIPGLNPKKMQAMMRQMGIRQEDIDADRVIIECSDKNIIINNPNVAKIEMQGSTNFQISGDVTVKEIEDSDEDDSAEDVKTIMEKTGCTQEEANKARHGPQR